MISATKPRRSTGLEALKLLIGTGAMAATIGLWSLFANRDFIKQLTQPDTNVTAPLSSDVILDLPPIPTLVPFSTGSSIASSPTVEPTISSQDLRIVSAPSQPSTSSGSALAPRVVRSTSGGGGGGGTVTTTRSS